MLSYLLWNTLLKILTKFSTGIRCSSFVVICVSDRGWIEMFSVVECWENLCCWNIEARKSTLVEFTEKNNIMDQSCSRTAPYWNLYYLYYCQHSSLKLALLRLMRPWVTHLIKMCSEYMSLVNLRGLLVLRIFLCNKGFDFVPLGHQFIVLVL